MLQIIFGDDEHTAADGPYSRLLKTRKWLYLTSVSAIILGNGLYNENAAEEILKVIKLPAHFLTNGITIGLFYLIFQYSFLAVQLVSTYDIILSERFTFRRAEDLASAYAAEVEARSKYNTAVTSFNHNKESARQHLKESCRVEIASMEMNLEVVEGDVRDFQYRKDDIEELRKARHGVSRIKAIMAEKKLFLKRLDDPDFASKQVVLIHDPSVSAEKENLDRASSDLLVLKSQVPSLRRFYKWSEIGIDLFRIFPPLLLSILAVCMLLS